MATGRSSPVRSCVALLALLSTTACIWIFQNTQVQPVDRNADSLWVSGPIKAHLTDGSTVLYPYRVLIERDTLYGRGERFDITGAAAGSVDTVTTSDVAAIESFSTHADGGTSAAVSVLATAATALGTVALFKAVFGSCPTVYSDSAGTPTLEAELFSYSIAPLLERRDVDRLSAQPDADGVLSLDVRNEALETHYINHLQLLEVAHAADEMVMPDEADRVLAVSGLVHPDVIVDRRGRDLRPLLLADDSLVFRTDSATLAQVTERDFDDHIDIAMPAPKDADSVAVVFTMRNSLLTTVLLYDVMLRAQGARAIDWVADDLANISQVVQLGRWYGSRMGMHIAVWRNGRYEEVSDLSDTGPIAWRRVAAVVPVPPADTLRLRLTFVADQWRIGRLAVATRVRRPTPRTIALSSVITSAGTADSAALRNLRESDDRYLQTSAGQRFTIRFDVGPSVGDSPRTFLLASQGYYREWIRGEWIRASHDAHPFVASDSTLLVALHTWRAEQHDFERRFEQTRIPVR